MVNYACAFSQSESGKYFEWIIIVSKYSPNVMSNRLAKTITVYLFWLECIPLNEKWQKSFKANDSIDANNYRPISLLFKFNRIVEKLAFTREKTFIMQTIYFRHRNMASAKCIQRSMYFSILWISFRQTWISASSRMVYIFSWKRSDIVDHKILLRKDELFTFKWCPLSGVKTTESRHFEWLSV